ncbi:MAG TPA: LPS assembly lipoprotein LptE [Oligoflexia bacterium]|nr:LPS assembly lipoprotein LptE [Oligoflexia bacterium]
MLGLFRRIQLFWVLVVVLGCLQAGCGYNWQGTSNLWAKEKIEKIYIRTLDNKTLTAGVETFFTSAIIREFSKGRRLTITTSEGDADAVLWGTIESVDNTGSPGADIELGQVSTESGAGQLDRVPIFSEYVATAFLNINLTRRRDGEVVWNGGFGHPGYQYPGSARFGLPGTTSSLINDSQFKLALEEVAKTIATDVHDTLLERF